MPIIHNCAPIPISKYLWRRLQASGANVSTFAEKFDTGGAPGPPPRAGLVWNQQTHRWHRPAHEGGGEEPGQSGKKSAKPATKAAPLDSNKSKFIGQSVGAAEHKAADAVSNSVAKALGGVVEEDAAGPGQKDKKPFDVRVQKKGGGFHDIEVKSLLKGEKTSLSVHDDALLRKVDHMSANPSNTFHTVAKDERATYEGGQHAENYSGHDLYYKRGSGRYALSKMHKCKDAAELKRLIHAPDDKLPEAARGELPPPPPLARLRDSAAKASEGRKARDKARKERNKDVLRQQARDRAAAKKAGK